MRSPRSINDGLLRRALTALEPQTPLDPGHLRQHSFLINNLCSGNRLDDIYEELAALKDHDDPWLARAASTMLAGSPGSVPVVRAAAAHAAALARRCIPRRVHRRAGMCRAWRFRRGHPRAADRQGQAAALEPAVLDVATDAWVQKFFDEPWPEGQPHPLDDLGKQGR